MVHLVASRCKLGDDVVGQDGASNGRSEGVHGMVAMDFLGEAVSAEIIVLAVATVEELGLRKFCVGSVL